MNLPTLEKPAYYNFSSAVCNECVFLKPLGTQLGNPISLHRSSGTR